jgi:hypothetical protein
MTASERATLERAVQLWRSAGFRWRSIIRWISSAPLATRVK